MNRVVTCILNGKAGSNSVSEAEALIPRIAAELGAEARVIMPEQGSDLVALAREAGARGGVVAAGGGDGTISAVASALVDGDAALGVLPMGTLNHFAKDLGIPLELEAAVRGLFTGGVKQVDVGEVNGRVFLNNSSIGLYPQIVREREDLQKQGGHSKWVAFAHAASHVLRQSRTLRVELEGDAGTMALRGTPFLFVGNNRYEASGLEIGKRSGLDGGVLWLCAAPHAGRLKLAWLAAASVLGMAGRGDLVAFETRETVVRSRRRHVDVSTDGEVTGMETPLRYRVRPGALRVIVPG